MADEASVALAAAADSAVVVPEGVGKPLAVSFGNGFKVRSYYLLISLFRFTAERLRDCLKFVFEIYYRSFFCQLRL